MGHTRNDAIVLTPTSAVLRRRGLFAGLTALLLCLVAADGAAAERYAVIVTGASGGPQYAEKYDRWRAAIAAVLSEKHGYPPDHVVMLGETAADHVQVATRENVRAALAALRSRSTPADTVLVMLIGHGASVDGETAKFNLVGPDLSAEEWTALIKPLPSRVVFVNTASGSFPYLELMAGRNRIVVTANDSAAQQFETVMPEFFIDALGNDEADTDKNGKLSIWEAFSFASDGVKRWFEEKGQLPTERPLLDDTGAGTGREAGVAGADGFVAQVTYLRADPPIADTGDVEIDTMRRRRQALETELDSLRVRKETMATEQYEDALEKLLLELARIDRRLRSGS